MAQNYGVQLSIDVAHLLRQINAAIKTINTDGKTNPLKLSASTGALSASIRKAISEINSGGKLKNRPVNISASESKLRQSIATAIRSINSSGSLNGKAVNIKANLKLDDAVKKVRSQIAYITAKSGNINVGGNANNDALANVRKELEQEGQQLLTNNEYLRERATLFTKSGTIKTSTKYGSSGENITLNTTNGNLTSVTKTTDNSRIAAEQAKAEAAINRTRNALSALRAEYADINSTKPIKSDTENFKTLEAEYNKIIQLINEFERSDNKNTAQFKVNVESKIADFELMIERFQRAQYAPTSLRAKDVETSAAIEANRLDEFISKIKASNVPIEKMQSTIDSLKLSLSKISDAGSLTKFLNEFGIAQSEFSSLKAESKALSNEMSKVDASAKQITDSLKTLSNKGNQGIFLKNGGNENVVAMQKVFADLTAKYTALQTSLKNDSSAENLAIVNKELSTLQKQLQKALTDSEALKKSLKNIKMSEDLTKKANTLLGQISQYERANGKALDTVNPISGITFGAELEQIKAAIPNVRDLGTIDQLNNRFVTLRANVKTLGKEGNTTFTEMKNSAAKFVKWMGMTWLFTNVRMYFNELFSTVIDLDTALVDLKKTFKGSTEELNDFYFEANRLAKQMGVTTAEIIKQGAAFSRLGYSSNETMKKMAEMSAMFAAISPDMNTEQAQDGLVSIIKAFNIDPDNVLDGILSKVNIIGNTAATSNGEIVEMLKRSSAAMRESNNTLEETIALETAAIEVTRDAPGTGVAWKTISARLRGLDEETLQVSDDITELTGKFADFTKTAKTPGGISLFTDESKTTYKSTYQIIKELSEIWDDLTDVQTARIGEVIGGKRQLQVVSAAIENFEAAEKALDNMANSAGSAEAEMDTIRQSAAYALNEFKETFTSLAQNSVGRGELKALINTGTAMLELLNGLVKTFGALPVAIGAASAAITAFKKKGEGLLGYNSKGNFTFWGAETKNGFKAWYNEKTDPTGQKAAQKAQIKNQMEAVKEFDSAIKSNSMNLQTYNAVMKSSNDNVKRYGRAVMQGTDQTKAFKTVNKQLKTELRQVGKNSEVAANGTKKLNAAMKAFNAIGSMVKSMLLSWAISAVLSVLIKAVDNSIHAVENLNTELSDLASEAVSITKELESINDELKTTKEKIAELEKLPKLTLLQEDELKALKAYNDELERQRKQREKDARQNEIKAHENAEKLAKNTFLAGADPRIPKSDIIDSNKELIESKIKTYKRLKEELQALEEAEYRDTNKIGEKQLELEEVEYELLDIETSLKNINENLIPSDKNMKKILDYSKNLLQQWNTAYGAIPDNLKELYESAQFNETVKQLEKLADAGELTAEKFAEFTNEDVVSIEEFKKALENIDGATFEEVVESIIVNAEEAKKKLDDTTKSVNSFAEALEKLEDIVSKQESLADAFKKIQLNGSLSPKEAKDLLKEMPDLLKYLEPTADGYTILAENIKAANEEIIKSEKETLREQILTKKTQIGELEKMRELAIELHNTNGQDADLVDRFFEQSEKTEELREALGIELMSEIPKGIEKLREELKESEFQLDLLDEAFDGYVISDIFDDAKSAISEYNNEIKTLDSSIKSLNEGAALSYDEIVDIVEIASELGTYLEPQENGEYLITASMIEELRKQNLQARNEYIDGLMERAKAELQAAKDTKQTCEIILNMEKQFGDASEQLAAQIEFDAAEALIKQLQGAMSVLQAMKSDITSSDSNSSVSDELQNEIDYYKNIISAVEIMRDKYSEAIDSEIDALQDVKDSLQETNDERERELDLIEARNNLENAKKRKVWVYSDDGGFRQVQDEGAVKEAEEKYRDAITEIQVAEIDKEIELREKQKEALEENTKALTELEQNIQDALTVEQAKADLGLSDEKELLNLPADVQEGIKNGLADAMVQQANKENEGTKHKKVTFEDILKSMGAKVSATDLEEVKRNLVTASQYNTQNALANSLKEAADTAVTNIVNNNGNTINNPVFNINGVNDPNEITKAIHDYFFQVFTRLGNSIK